jgi:hypothetical protein
MVEKTSAQRSSSVTAAAGALAVPDSQDRSLDIREPRQWREAITRLVCHANITTAPSTRFSGTVRNTPLGCLNILEIESEYEYGARTRRHIAKDHNDNLVLVFVRSGVLEITQLERKVVLPPGMFSVYDLSQPYTYGHPHRTEVLAIKIPAATLGSRIGKVGRFIGQPYSASAGVGRLTADFLKCVSREADHIPEAAAFSYGTQVIDLVGIVLECGSEKLPIAHSAVKSALYSAMLLLYKKSDRKRRFRSSNGGGREWDLCTVFAQDFSGGRPDLRRILARRALAKVSKRLDRSGEVPCNYRRDCVSGRVSDPITFLQAF